MKRRKFPRLDESWNLTYRVIESASIAGSPINALMLNVSGGGICFSVEAPLAPGSILAVEMESADLDSPVICLARCVWCNPRKLDGRHDVGAEFFWVGWKDDTAQVTIAEYVKQHTVDATGAGV